MSQYEVLDKFLAESNLRSNIVVQHTFPAQEAEWAEIPKGIHTWVKKTLAESGYQKLYLHQNQAINNILRGANTVISTGVSSGKSLCYQVPILHTLAYNQHNTALLMYPTKALAQDQRKSFLPLLEVFSAISSLDPKLYIYDGDTEQQHKKSIRQSAKILLTNPDMLHLGILPKHSGWANFFANLKYVVIDEVHIYRGIFGSHFTNVLRRLKRICDYYGSNPVFILTSATLGNTSEFIRSILEDIFVIVKNDYSPQGNRHFLIYNPPLVNQELGIRRSAMVETIRIADYFIKEKIQTLIFTVTRRSVELIVSNLKKGNIRSLTGYRSGYLKNERRQIEDGLKSGELTSVVSTNALELGIDIGDLDVVIINGYPGTIASTLQQAGRTGRTGNDSLVILVANSTLINQYLVKNPDYLFLNTPEQALLDANNPYILLDHLKCAIYELPLNREKDYTLTDNQDLNQIINFLLKKGLVIERKGNIYWNSEEKPASQTSLRTLNANNFVVVHEGVNIGTIDYNSANWFAHEKAVYIHNGEPFIVTEYKADDCKIVVKSHDDDYFTEPVIETEYELKQELDKLVYPYGEAYYAVLNVHSRVSGFKKIKLGSREILDTEDLDLPQTTLPTKGIILALSDYYENFLLKHGISSQINNYGKNWRETTHLVKQRDHYTCQNCGKIEGTTSFDVHHIIPFKAFSDTREANKLENLVTLCKQCHHQAEIPVKVQTTMSGLAYLIRHLSPLYLMCADRDIQVNYTRDANLVQGKGAIVIYDTFRGGIGLAKKLFSNITEILKLCYQQVNKCSCSDGCPTCTGPVAENGYTAKESVKEFLAEIIGESDGRP